MVSETSFRSVINSRPLVVLFIGFVAVTALLVFGYAYLLNPRYTTLFSDLRASDAAAIVAELDKRGTKYRLEDSGSAIAVPADQADETRLALAGSDLSERGIVGFELFNKSDMGLTNFAQKINYQRALQGELARTIMMIDGIDTARVHLALPEKTLFSDAHDEPKAAVTVATKTGATLDASQIAGIRELVAASVPDLPLAQVVILDETGRVVSSAPGDDDGGSAEASEHQAVEQYYRARARAAIEAGMPGMQFALHLLALPVSGAANTAQTVNADSADESRSDKPAPGATATSPAANSRDFALRIVFVSPAMIDDDDQQLVRGALEQAVDFSSERGDSLAFESGPINDDVSPAALPTQRAGTAAALPGSVADASHGWAVWPWLLGLIIVLLLVGLSRRSARERRVLSDAECDTFAERLSRRIAMDLEGADAA